MSLPERVIRDAASFAAALRGFIRKLGVIRKVQQDGILSEAKHRPHYHPPSIQCNRRIVARDCKARKAPARAAARRS